MMGIDYFAKNSEIPASRWSSVTYKNVRMSTEELDVLQREFPQYRLWLISGEIVPEIGQTSPEYDAVTPSGPVGAK
ncbi:MAG: hypothetical protein LAT81_13455 [Oceanicaulis sp.]|nr:hypothetical protein [Oceanicaulis sp.]